MSMINCPECGKEISDKAEKCPNCGCPSSEWIKETDENDLEKVVKEITEKYNENETIKMIKELREKRSLGLKEAQDIINSYIKTGTIPEVNQTQKEKFEGVYRVAFFGGMQAVYCPRCGSEDCSHYQEQKIIPGKTKIRYTVNLNPLRPFTLVNKKEKTIKKEDVITKNKFACNKCGKIFN